MAFEVNEFILEKHIKIVLNSYFTDVYETHDSFNFRCAICGDSKKDKFKKRGYILKSKTPWVYYCHNCNTSMSAMKWIKEYYPSNYRSYIKEVMINKPKSDNNTYKNIKTSKTFEDYDERVDVQHFKSILKFPDAVEFCENRRIPKEVYSKWKYCVDGKYVGRIIITFLNKEGKPYYYQGRSFNNNSGMKYLSRKGDHCSIYNYYNVDPDKPVVILEGPIDSIFVENSIAVTGLKLKSDDLDIFNDKYFMLDNDASGWRQSIKRLKRGDYVFNWSKFLSNYHFTSKIKDVNDFILAQDQITHLTWDMIEPYFTKNINDKIYFIGDKL